MPKDQSRTSLHINILQPQGNPEKIYVRFTRWLLSTGRYIIIIVEIIVLGAFVSRFKIDSDLETTKEASEQQIPFIESLKQDEQLIRQTQLQLATIRDIRQTTPDYTLIMQKISGTQPLGIKITSLNLEKNSGIIALKITGQAKTNNDLSNFVAGLKADSNFSDINLVGAGVDQNIITFSITGSVRSNLK